MARVRRSQGLTRSAALASDLICLPVSIGPGAVAWTAGLLYVRHFWEHSRLWLLSLATPLVIYFAFVATIFVFRLVLPKMKKGVYPAGFNRGMLAWYFSLALNRAMYIAGLKPLVQAFHFTKFLYWRALGAKIAFNVNTSIGVTFVDVPLISIGPGSTVSEYAHLSCHTFTGDRLFVSPIEIGKNVFIGMNCIVGAGSRIGDGAWIGMYNKVVSIDTVAAGSKIDNFSWEHGNPEKRKKSTATDPRPT